MYYIDKNKYTHNIIYKYILYVTVNAQSAYNQMFMGKC